MAARLVRPGVLIALPSVPFQEQSLFDRKLARIRQLEQFMVDFDARSQRLAAMQDEVRSMLMGHSISSTR